MASSMKPIRWPTRLPAPSKKNADGSAVAPHSATAARIFADAATVADDAILADDGALHQHHIFTDAGGGCDDCLSRRAPGNRRRRIKQLRYFGITAIGIGRYQ